MCTANLQKFQMIDGARFIPFYANQNWLPFMMQYPSRLHRRRQLEWINDIWIAKNL
jgi:hypothetical protein